MKKKISFVGLGKLGLPLATNFAKNGHKVLAIDKNSRLIEFICVTYIIYFKKELL